LTTAQPAPCPTAADAKRSAQNYLFEVSHNRFSEERLQALREIKLHPFIFILDSPLLLDSSARPEI